MGEKWKRIVRPTTADERERHAEIREQVMQEFPPLDPPRRQPAVDGIGVQIRAAREGQGMTRHALAKKAGLSNSTMIRDVEYGCDATLSEVRAIAEALGLELTLAEPAT